MIISRKLPCCSRLVLWTSPATLLGTVLSITATLSPATAQDALTRIKQDGVMHVENSGVYPPFEWMEEGKLIGFDIDLSHLIAKELGVRADIQVVDFKGLIAAIKSGKTDMCICGFAYTPERAQQVALSKAYYPTAFTIVVQGNTPDIASKDALSGKRIGVEFGTTSDREARSVPNADVKSYDTLMLAMKDLQNSRVDAIIGNLPPVRYLINRNFKDLKITHTYSEGYIAVAMRLEDKTLVQAINSALDKLKAEGRLRELELRWFGEVSN